VPLSDIEKRREYDRKRSKARYDPEKARAYYQANRERILARQREYEASLPPEAKTRRRQYKTAKQREYEAAKPTQSKRDRDRAWRLANPDQAWAHSLKSAHGMRPEQWHAMYMEQRGQCYLCERPLPDDRSQVAVDHDHSHCGPGRSCGVCRRGLAHHACNAAIGLVLEDAKLLRVIAANLERAAAVTQALIMSAPQQGTLDLGDVS
jgi:hypothetical protein